MDVRDWWRAQGKSVAIVLGLFFAALWFFSGNDDDSKVETGTQEPPTPSVSVDDARLYVPTSLPGIDGETGLLGSKNSPREARFRGKSGSATVTLLASSLGQPLDLAAGTPTTIGKSVGYTSTSGDSRSVTWKRGNVILRVTSSDPKVDSNVLQKATIALAEKFDQRADRVMAMSADERAKELTNGEW